MKNSNKYPIILTLAALAILCVGLWSPSDDHIREIVADYVEWSEAQPNLGADTVLPIAGATYNLSGSGVSSSATSIVLSSLTLPQTGQKLLDADFSSTFYLTIEPGNRSRQEIVSCTTVVQGSNSATLSGCTRGLSPITPYTASTSLQFAHAGGATVIFSNPPQLYNQFAAKDNDETITGYWEGPNPITAAGFATRAYVDGAAFQGIGAASETATGTVELATQAEAVASTNSGSLGRLALGANLSTSTWNSNTAANRVLMSGAGGTLDDDFLPATITKALTLTASTFAAPTTTMSGSLTLSGNSATSNIASTTIYATTTTGTWTKPANLKFVIVEVVGGGGGGSGRTTAGEAGGGGGGGGYSRKVIPAGAIASTVTVTVGAGGTAGSGGGGTGGDGGTSSFGSHVQATGGGGGTGTNGIGGGGAGGAGSLGDFNLSGGAGSAGFQPAANQTFGGSGGDSQLGRGAPINMTGSGAAGADGATYGGGGSGASSGSSNNDFAGGAGGAGVVLITSVFF